MTRVGEQGLEGRASHDHDDALHTWLSFKGEDILVDTGSKPYSLDKIIRNNCIVSSAHNVLKVKSKERFMPSQGSIVKTIRGASVASNHSHLTFEEQCILVANLDIQENSDFDAVKRIIKTSKVNLKYLCELNDSWELIAVSKTEIYWRFPISKTPTILKDDRKSKKIIFNVNNFNVEIIFEASIDFNLEIFSFDFSSKYGSKNLCYGAHLVFNKSVKGQAFCKVYIDEV